MTKRFAGGEGIGLKKLWDSTYFGEKDFWNSAE